MNNETTKFEDLSPENQAEIKRKENEIFGAEPKNVLGDRAVTRDDVGNETRQTTEEEDIAAWRERTRQLALENRHTEHDLSARTSFLAPADPINLTTEGTPHSAAQKPVMESIGDIMPRIAPPAGDLPDGADIAFSPEKEQEAADLAPDLGNLPQFMQEKIASGESVEPSDFFDERNAPPIPFEILPPETKAARNALEMVPEFGAIFNETDLQQLLGEGVPPKIAQTIVKAQYPREAVLQVAGQFQTAIAIRAEMAARLHSIVVRDENDDESMAEARQFGKMLQAERIATEDRRKNLGMSALRQKQVIDSIGGYLRDSLKDLEAIATEKANFKINAEKKRKEERLEKRVISLKAYGAEDGWIKSLGLLEMSEENFEITLRGQTSTFYALQRDAAKIKEEAEEAQRQQIERMRQLEEEARLANQKAQAEEARANEEKRQREIIEEEQREAKAEEFRQQRDREEAEEALKRAPDKEKLAVYAAALLAEPLPELESPEAKAFAAPLLDELKTLCAKLNAFK